MTRHTPQQTATDRLTPAQNENGRGRMPLWASSPQADLWNYLKPEQQRVMRPILRKLKNHAQVDLCVALLDYMETGEQPHFDDVLIGGLFGYLTSGHIKPLRIIH